VTAPGEFPLVVPAALLQQQVAEFGRLLLQLYLPDACTPQSLGINNDTRALAIAVHAIKVRE
jgi:hypothetical protein